MMDKKDHNEREIQTRIVLDRFYSVDFLLKETGNVYQFKIRDMSSQGLGILVREDSEVLQYIAVGQEVDMQYNPPKDAGPPETFKTRIRHITPRVKDTPDGHFVIGLEIITRQTVEEQTSL